MVHGLFPLCSRSFPPSFLDETSFCCTSVFGIHKIGGAPYRWQSGNLAVKVLFRLEQSAKSNQPQRIIFCNSHMDVGLSDGFCFHPSLLALPVWMPTYGFRVRCRITKWLLKVPRRNGVLVAVTSIRQGTVAQGNESGMAQVWRSGKVIEATC